MKIFIINQMYTSLLLMIISSAYVSSISLGNANGRTIFNDKYEIILGGPPDAMTIIDGLSFAGVKSVRELTPNEILALNSKPMNENEIERKQEKEKREKPRRVAKKTQCGSEVAQNITKRLKSNNGQQFINSNTQNTPPKRLVRRNNSNARRKLYNMNVINV